MLNHPVVNYRCTEDCEAEGRERGRRGPDGGNMRGKGTNNRKNKKRHPPLKPLENSVCSTCTGISVFMSSMERNSCFGWRTWYRISREQAMLIAREEKEWHRGSHEQGPYFTTEVDGGNDKRTDNSGRLEFVQVLIGKSRMLEENGYLPVLISSGIDLTSISSSSTSAWNVDEEEMDVPQQTRKLKQQPEMKGTTAEKQLQQGSREEKGLEFENVGEIVQNLCRSHLKVATEYARNFPLHFPGVVVNIVKNLGRAPEGYIPFMKKWYRYIYTGGRSKE